MVSWPPGQIVHWEWAPCRNGGHLKLELYADPQDDACKIAAFLATNAADVHGAALTVHAVSRPLVRASHGGYGPGDAPGSSAARWRALDLVRTAERYGVTLAPSEPGPPSDAVVAASERAAARGVFDVPAFVIDGGPVIYGLDRWPLVQARIAPACAYVPPVRAGAVEVFHDVASPYSYLGVLALIGSGATVAFTPILLGALFRDLGTPDVPVAAMSEARRQWVLRDLHDWAAFRGLPFRYSTRFPIRSVTAQRVTLLEPRAIVPLYTAAWAQDRPISEPADVAAVLHDAGLDGAGLVRRSGEARDALRANTERARSLGVFGVPTYRVADALFWGQDHLEAALEASTGR